MAQLAAFWAKLTMLVSTIRFSDIVDILIVAYLIYNVIMLIRKTNSYRLAQGVLLILIALWLSGVLKLTMFNRILQKTVELGLIALVIIFQPELRRLLERMGSKALPRFGAKPLETLGMDNVISQTIAACTQLSATKTGALIVFERSVTLDEQMRSGTIINSDVTAELLKNIFYPKAPLHDGAVIIRGVRIACAAAYFPPTTKELPTSYGARHRAAVGISEITDSITIIVSEETGTISIAEAGELKSYTSEELRDYLMTRYQIERREPRQELPQPAVEESAEQEPRTDDLIPTEAVVVKYHRRRKSGRRRRKGGEGSA